MCYSEYERKRAGRCGHNLSGFGYRPKQGSGKHEKQEISWPGKRLPPSKEGLFSTERVIIIYSSSTVRLDPSKLEM